MNRELHDATAVTQNYGENEIQVLEGLEAVRKRPGMYIGSTDSRGLHHLVYEIVDNAVDEALAGYCKRIDVTLHNDGSVSVHDDGRGFPVGIHPKMGRPAVEVCLTILHAGGKFGGGGYKVSGGLHGVGASVVNALSNHLTVTVYQDGKIHQQEYARGKYLYDLKVIGETDQTGTTIRFWPDIRSEANPDGVFEPDVQFEYDVLRRRLREMAYLNKGIRIVFTDERGEEPKVADYCFEGGLKQFVQHLNRNKELPEFPQPIYAEGMKDGILVEVAMQYNSSYQENIYTFVNNIATPDGGTHLTGFNTALTATINDYGRKFKILKEKDENLKGEDVRESLTAIVSIKMEDPQFESQTKSKLGSAQARSAVYELVKEALSTYLEETPSEGKAILERCLSAQRAREAARKARETMRRSPLASAGMPGKLVDCSEKDPAKCEIFLVEGDSAGGSAVGGRNSKFQAILPLRGKILNVEKTRVDKALGNAEIRGMITAFGCGFGEDFDESKLRYHRIVCMTDADVDGAHIRILLLTFFYRYMRPLVEKGYVYAAMPPLYKVTRGKFEKYVYSDEELQELLDELGRDSKPEIQRYKGLGEMNKEQLWETTMNPETRTMMQITPEDAMAADEIFTLLMGDQVEPRKLFIQENSDLVKDLDV
ncbi:MAG: DNA topoisomerase (ATP-hydrolyzing) subunit B [Clostridia bacterium]|nr:DNA topoisomerase (ATP-hydrolyzing) subunit B [Clostridia bacterium]